MNKPVLQDGYDPVTEADITAFEQKIGARLPDDYRRFLLKQNGGRYAQEVLWEPANQGEKKNGADVQRFYPLNEQIGEDGLLKHYQHDRSYLPKLYLPIGSEGTGCTFYLCLQQGRHYGSVWFWDREREIAESFQKLEPTFQSFVDHIIYDPDSDWEEDAPAFLACAQGDTEKLEQLIQNGLDINTRKENGDTLLMRAAWGQPRVLEYLLTKQPYLEAQNATGRRAMHCAAGTIDCARTLLDAGASLNVADDDGWTPLMEALSCNNVRASILLINHGADVNAESNYGDTPLSLCLNSNYDGRERRLLVDALRKAGAREDG